ncbi:unnamed protein product [Calicophoron daubneyi]|uniref:Uncharacterized protein n=1 Tax=Calicophoron daubneyi TaxID=300641 RepID=A0AAV2T8E6_CALDB
MEDEARPRKPKSPATLEWMDQKSPRPRPPVKKYGSKSIYGAVKNMLTNPTAPATLLWQNPSEKTHSTSGEVTEHAGGMGDKGSGVRRTSLGNITKIKSRSTLLPISRAGESGEQRSSDSMFQSPDKSTRSSLKRPIVLHPIRGGHKIYEHSASDIDSKILSEPSDKAADIPEENTTDLTANEDSFPFVPEEESVQTPYPEIKEPRFSVQGFTARLLFLPFPAIVILHELYLLWWFIQLMMVLSIVFHFDWNLRVRPPVPDYPRYIPSRAPWIPGQRELFKRIQRLWGSILFIYLPATCVHLGLFLDHTQQSISWSSEDGVFKMKLQWYKNERYQQLIRPKKRQLLNAGMLALQIFLLFQCGIVMATDLNSYSREAYWRRTIKIWLSEIRHYYFLEFKDIETLINEEDVKKAYYTPDNDNRKLLLIDVVQSMFECCGLENGYMDWSDEDVLRPVNKTYRQALGIRSDDLKSHHRVPTLTKKSVPFSCCRFDSRTRNPRERACDHLELRNPAKVYSRGCVEVLTKFLVEKWIAVNSRALLVVFMTMIPQVALSMATLQPTQLVKQNTIYLIRTATLIGLCMIKLLDCMILIKRKVRRVQVLSKELEEQEQRGILRRKKEVNMFDVIRQSVAEEEARLYEKPKQHFRTINDIGNFDKKKAKNKKHPGSILPNSNWKSVNTIGRSLNPMTRSPWQVYYNLRES